MADDDRLAQGGSRDPTTRHLNNNSNATGSLPRQGVDDYDVGGGHSEGPRNISTNQGDTDLSPRRGSDQVRTAAEVRAGQLGISLHAPASTDPAILEAATQSTGIDPTFLAALPEDVRSEVLAQHIEQMATEATVPGSEARNISSNQEFLSALPPNLRAEVLDQEAQILARRRAEAQGAEMDNASFLATLTPQLREEVLLNADENFLGTLPQGLSEEARQLRQRERQIRPMNSRFQRGILQGSVGDATARPRLGRSGNLGTDPGRRAATDPYAAGADRSKAHTEVPIFLDEESVTAVIKVWYSGTSLGRGLLYRVLLHTCKNKEMRRITLQLLLEILSAEAKGRVQDMPASESSRKPSIMDKMGEARDRLPRATVIRGTLELLMNLAEKDKSIARSFMFSDGSPQEELPLNKLLSVMAYDPFTRSTATLEALIRALTVVCSALPSQGGSNKGSGRLGRSRRGGSSRRHRQRGLATLQIVNIQPESGNETTEEVNETTDLDEDVQHGGEGRPLLDGDANARVESETQASSEVKDKQTRSADKVPIIAAEDLERLAGVLSRQGCSEGTYQGIVQILGRLSIVPQNRAVAVRSLSTDANSLADVIAGGFDEFLEEMDRSQEEQDETIRASSLVKFSTCASAQELKLLRIMKTVIPLAKGHDGGLKATSMSLTRLWEALSNVLGAIIFREGPAHNTGGKRKVTNRPRDGAPTTSRSGGAGAAPSRASFSGAESEEVDADGYGTDSEPQKVGRHNIPPILSRLSPVIQAFFVAHSAEEEPRKPSSTTSLPSLKSPLISSMGSKDADAGRTESAMSGDAGVTDLGRFIELHRVPVNMLLRATPSLLEGDFFKAALKYSQWIDFDNKKTYFRNLIKQRTAAANPCQIELCVRREHVFEESYFKLRSKKAEEMKGRLQVQFQDEEGIDAGGVTREWYTILARKIFDANYALFRRSTAESATYQPNTLSYVNDHHLNFFHFVGRIIGKAIYDGQLLDAYFTRSFYKHILGIRPNYHDLEPIDPDYYKSLCWMLENDIEGVLDLTFSAEYDDFGVTKVVDLIPNGRRVPVTNDNKKEYVNLITDLRLTKTIKLQIEHFLNGFQELIPREDIKIFNELELELLMSGLPEIDVADLKANVEYLGYTLSSPQINWFWKTVSEMGREDLARLVMFTTGTSKVPLEGFAALQGMNGHQKFQIHRVAGDSNRLPTAHTCFNQLDLPEYSDEDKLRRSLLVAIREGAEGFGFG